MFISTTPARFFKTFPHCVHQYCDHQAREKDTNETD